MLVRVLCCLVLGVVLCGCAAPPPDEEESDTVTGLENGSFTANLNGFDIHYEVHGQGPVLMTVPNSWGLSLEGLRALYRPLEERVTMVYFDPRGMGESGPIVEESDMSMVAVRADFDALRRLLGLDRVHAIGWSNGAGNLIFLSEEYPDTLESAIYLHGLASFTEEDMAAFAERYPEMMEIYEKFQAEMADETVSDEEKTARLRIAWLEEIFPFATADPEGAPAMLTVTFADAEFSWPHADYANREMPVFDARDKLPAIQVRSLVLAGAHDNMPPEKVRELHDGLPDSEFVVFANSGHFAPVEEPEVFRTAIFAFLGVE
jgi:proline iminopeptidase